MQRVAYNDQHPRYTLVSYMIIASIYRHAQNSAGA